MPTPNAPTPREERPDPAPDQPAEVGWHEPPPPPPIPDLLQRPAPSRGNTRQDASNSSLAGMGKAWGTAFDFIFTIIAGAGLGWLFDRWQHTEPKGVMVGMALGFVIAFVRIVRATQAQDRAENAPQNRDQNPP